MTSDSDKTFEFMNDFEREILQLSDLLSIVDLACEHVEGSRVDEATNLLIALKLLIESKEDRLHSHFQKAWQQFMVPTYRKAYGLKKTWAVKVGPEGEIIFPDDLIHEVQFKDHDLLDVCVNELNNTIIVKKVCGVDDEQQTGCMGDILSDEQIQALREKGLKQFVNTPLD